VVCRVADVVERRLGGRVIILTPENSTVHELDETGSRIWQLLEEPKSITTLAHAIVNEYEVSDDRAQWDITEFIRQLMGKGVLELV